VGSGYRVGLQAGGHRFDPGTLHVKLLDERVLGGGVFVTTSPALRRVAWERADVNRQ
jgi:hypothetical protein